MRDFSPELEVQIHAEITREAEETEITCGKCGKVQDREVKKYDLDDPNGWICMSRSQKWLCPPCDLLISEGHKPVYSPVPNCSWCEVKKNDPAYAGEFSDGEVPKAVRFIRSLSAGACDACYEKLDPKPGSLQWWNRYGEIR